MYQAFFRRRLGDDWPKELGRIKKWLQRDDRSTRGPLAS
jgi:hypothetical protein